jgi:hydrogenase/urease accessory protein HupE
MRRVQWPGPLQSLQIELDTFDATVPALTLKALRGNSTEVAIYTSHQSQHEFFQGFFRSLTQFIGVGVEHILGGADHLLFLLTVLIAGAGWRYWIGVISSFTLAHSLSLTCAVLGWVQISPRVVEPCIAASIVFMALDNLWRGQVNTRQRMLLVFGCGLLHGLGFASAIASLGASGHSLWASLLGFNLGVEFGQLIFIAVSLTALGILPKLIRSWQPPSLARALSIGAVLAASAMLLQRVG